MINKKIYLPLLSRFAAQTKDIYTSDGKGYPHGVFVPYTMKNYAGADYKIFVVGQDTYYWMDDALKNGAKRFCEMRDAGALPDYLEMESSDDKLSVTYDRIIGPEWKSGVFWSYVPKLVFALREGRLPDGRVEIRRAQEYLSEIGYGNLFPVELDHSLDNEGCTYDPVRLQTIREASSPLGSFKAILEAYNPDCIIVLSWTDGLTPFEGLEQERIEDPENDDFAWTYALKGYGTKILWTRHPRNLRGSYGTDEETIQRLLDIYFRLIRRG